MVLETAAFHNGDVNNNGVKHMDAGKNVRGSIRLMELCYQPGAYILPRVYYGTQIRTVLINRANHQADGHTYEQECAHPVIVPAVLKEEIQDRSAYIKKPENIRNDEILIKGNEIIYPCVYNMIILCYMLFQIEKPWQINKCVTKQPCVSVARYKTVHEPTFLKLLPPKCISPVISVFRFQWIIT